MYETPWIERQCRCPKNSYTAHIHSIDDELPTYIHHQLSNTFIDNIKHHRIYTKINITNNNQHKISNNDNNNNHHQRHHILSPLDSIGLTNPSSLEYDVDTINNDDNVKTFFQHMDISIDDDIIGNNNNKQQHHYLNNNNYNDYEVVDQYHNNDHRNSNNKNNDDDNASSDSSSVNSGSDSNGIIIDNTDDLYGKRKLRHRGGGASGDGQQQQLNDGVCPSNIAADDGYTIADKTRQYKLCEPIYKLPQCRYN